MHARQVPYQLSYNLSPSSHTMLFKGLKKKPKILGSPSLSSDFFSVWDRAVPHSPGWPWTHSYPAASVSQVLGWIPPFLPGSSRYTLRASNMPCFVAACMAERQSPVPNLATHISENCEGVCELYYVLLIKPSLKLCLTNQGAQGYCVRASLRDLRTWAHSQSGARQCIS